MGLKSLIQDGTGTKRTARVNKDNALVVTSTPLSVSDLADSEQLDILTRRKAYVETLTNATYGSDLNLNGSVTPVQFSVTAEVTRLKAVSEIRFVMHDTQLSIASSEGQRFGSAASSPGLTNGINLKVYQTGVTTSLFVNPLKQAVEFFYYADQIVNETGALGAGVDLLVARFKLAEPTLLVPTTDDRIYVTISDNLSSMVFFQVYISGYQELTS